MKYPFLEPRRTKQFFIDALQNGCNLQDGERQTENAQLLKAENLWWKNGALRTRPALNGNGREVLVSSHASVTWKFSGEETFGAGENGRRFLRRTYNVLAQTVCLETGILTYGGYWNMQGKLESTDTSLDGMVVEYPYTATENVLIFLNNGKIYAQHSTDFTWREVSGEAYVPCVLIDGKGIATKWQEGINPAPNYEGRNLLTDRFCAKYTTDGLGYVFCLPYTDISGSDTIVVRYCNELGGEQVYTVPADESYSERDENGIRVGVSRVKGTFFFANEAHDYIPLPSVKKNNLTVYASKARTQRQKNIVGSMRVSTWYGGSRAGGESRRFFSGSEVVPNRVYWTAQGQPLYFPFSNYIAVGDVRETVVAFGKQDDKLILFKEKEIYSLYGPKGTVSELWEDGQLSVTANAHTEYFALSQVHSGVGCASSCTVQLCGNQLYWLSAQGGVCTLVGGANGYAVRELSSPIAPLLSERTATDRKTALSCVLDGHYVLCMSDRMYVLRVDEKLFGQYTGVSKQQPAWYVWKIPFGLNLQYLCGTGQSALAIAATPEGTDLFEQVLQFEDASFDVVPQGGVLTAIPVEGTLITKHYDFGLPFTRKRILRLHTGLETAADTTVRFSYWLDAREREEAVMLTAPSGVCTLTPACARVQRFGICIKLQGAGAVDSIAVIYR